MKREVKKYPESTKRNVVAAVRSGLSQKGIARRLRIPITTVHQWMINPKYADVGPIIQELLDALPTANKGIQRMVKISIVTPHVPSGMKISNGRMTFESDAFTSDSISMIIEDLGGTDAFCLLLLLHKARLYSIRNESFRLA